MASATCTAPVSLSAALLVYLHITDSATLYAIGQHRCRQIVRSHLSLCACRARALAGADGLLYNSWGKRDTSLILPTNSSLSVTLSQDHLRSLTSARTVEGSAQGSDRLWLNGEEEEIKQGGRTERCLQEMRSIRKAIEVSRRVVRLGWLLWQAELAARRRSSPTLCAFLLLLARVVEVMC